MLTRPAALLLALSIGVVARGEDLKRLRFDKMSPGSRFQFTTDDRLYRGEMVDPTTGEARLVVSIDGQNFSGPQTVFLLGATQGRQQEAGGLMLVKMNQLQAGMRVELGFGSLDESHRAVTEPIRSIRME